MLSRKDRKLLKKQLHAKYDEWITKGTGTAAEYLGMTDKEFENWIAYGTVPERMYT